MGNSGSKKKTKRRTSQSVLCEPTGLYESCQWSTRAVSRQIVAKKLAPRYKGTEEAADSGVGSSECPICFLYYTELNHVTCCKNDICTECYLQVKLPDGFGPSSCPFCNSPTLAAVYTPQPAPQSPGKSDMHSFDTPPTNNRNNTIPSISPQTPEKPSVSSSPVVVSTAERQKLEQVMQSQRGFSDFESPYDHRRRSNSTGSDYLSGRTRTVRSNRSQQRENERRRSMGINEFEGNNSFENYDMSFNLEQVEEMMFMEAIRLSMLEPTTIEESFNLPPPPPNDVVKDTSEEFACRGNSVKNIDSQIINEKVDEINFEDDMPEAMCQYSDVDLSCEVENEKSNTSMQEEVRSSDISCDDEDKQLLELALSLSLQSSSTGVPLPNYIECKENRKELISSDSGKLTPSHADNNFLNIPQFDASTSNIDGSILNLDPGRHLEIERNEINENNNNMSPAAKRLVDRIERALSDCSVSSLDKDPKISTCIESSCENNSDHDTNDDVKIDKTDETVKSLAINVKEENGSSSDEEIGDDYEFDIRVIKSV